MDWSKRVFTDSVEWTCGDVKVLIERKPFCLRIHWRNSDGLIPAGIDNLDRQDGPAEVYIWNQNQLYDSLSRFKDPREIDNLEVERANLKWYIGGVLIDSKRDARIVGGFPKIDQEFILRKIAADGHPTYIGAWVRVARRLKIFSDQALMALELL